MDLKELTDKEVEVLRKIIAFQRNPKDIYPRLKLLSGDADPSSAWHRIRSLEHKGYVRIGADENGKTVEVLHDDKGELFKQQTPMYLKGKVKRAMNLLHSAKYEECDEVLKAIWDAL